MSFLDEIRQQRQAVRKITDEEIYYGLLEKYYSSLKSDIRRQAAVSNARVVSGEYLLDEGYEYLPGGLDRIEHEQSAFHNMYYDSANDPKVSIRGLCDVSIKHGFISASAKATLTALGSRFTNDLMNLGKKDEIHMWFTPLFRSWGAEKYLSEFDQFEKIGNVSCDSAECKVVLHYRVQL